MSYPYGAAQVAGAYYFAGLAAPSNLSGTVTLDDCTASGALAGVAVPEPLTNAEMRQMFYWVSDLAKIHGLISGVDLVVASNLRSAGGINQTITSVSGVTTVSRL